MKTRILSTILALSLAFVASSGTTALAASEVDCVEPPCWWVGMDTDLQLMICARDIKNSTVSLSEEIKGLSIGKVYSGDSDDFLWVDVKIGNRLPEGTYTFNILTPSGKHYEFDYEILQRSNNSSRRKSFGPEDVVYLLMPDRFANGSKLNDNSSACLEKADGKKSSGRHGGDIQGIIDNLDYIQDLGATTIWSTPLLMDDESEYSYHGYACADFYRIDPRYGSNQLYRQFVEKAHNRNMKVIMDVVLNHCGTAHWWMEDLPFDDWLNYPDNLTKLGKKDFVRTNSAMSSPFDPHASKFDKENFVEGWFDTSMPDLNLKNQFLLHYLVQMAVWWVEYADLDGLRVDTFPYSDKKSVADWTRSVLKEYPHLNIVGECWFNDPLSCSYWEGRKQRDGYNSHLPSVMDFPLREAIIEALTTEGDSWNPGMNRIYNTLALDFVYDKPYNLMIFAGNHDTNRLAYELDGDVASIKMAYAILATMRGVPQLYYGDELGLQSADGTTGHSQERVDMEWSPSKDQKALYNWIGDLFNWRKTSKAVATGDFIHFRPAKDNVYVYFRTVRGESVMTIINGGQEDYFVDWDHFSEITSKFAAKGKNIVDGDKVTVGSKFIVEPRTAAILEFK